MSKSRKLALVVIAACLFTLAYRGCDGVSIGAKPTAATYFYDDKQHVVPSPVMVAIDKLNRAGILATFHEVDTTDESGDVPEQYKVSLPAAKEAGLPAMVVMAGERVVRVVKGPTTAEQVLEAVGHE